jgi:formylglycine-generating enzyme required for sulfatase activity
MLAPGAPGVTLPINILSYLQQLTDSLAFPDPNVRARSDMRFVVVLEGIVGTERAVGADLWWKSDCPEGFPTPPGMVKIFPGTFQMGSNAAGGAPYYGNSGTQPVHQVTLSQCFWMGATEVTQAQYQSLMGTNPSNFPGANNPVEKVSWNDAQAYCAALTTQQAALGNVPAGYHYRLPTEAEWEYACRAGTTTEFNTGEALFCNDAKFYYSYHSNSFCNSNGTVPVGSYAPNAWGLYDMHGNVWEWCLDSYASYTAGAVTDPFVTGGIGRFIRGGSWDNTSVVCRSAFRYPGNPDDAGYDIGFRVVLAPVLVP